jgi:hypothetical protein
MNCDLTLLELSIVDISNKYFMPDYRLILDFTKSDDFVSGADFSRIPDCTLDEHQKYCFGNPAFGDFCIEEHVSQPAKAVIRKPDGTFCYCICGGPVPSGLIDSKVASTRVERVHGMHQLLSIAEPPQCPTAAFQRDDVKAILEEAAQMDLPADAKIYVRIPPHGRIVQIK